MVKLILLLRGLTPLVGEVDSHVERICSSHGRRLINASAAPDLQETWLDLFELCKPHGR